MLAINGRESVIKSKIEDEWEDIRKEDIDKVSEYLKNEPISVIDGGILKEFEDTFAKLVNAKYAVAYCNGTAALHVATYACGADKDCNFIASEYSYHGAINALLENNTKVYLCDYDKNTLGIDKNALERCINENTRGILITHCWGNLVNMDDINEIKTKYDLKIISDASHAHGAKWDGKTIGNLDSEDIVCFSLGKNNMKYFDKININNAHIFEWNNKIALYKEE